LHRSIHSFPSTVALVPLHYFASRIDRWEPESQERSLLDDAHRLGRIDSLRETRYRYNLQTELHRFSESTHKQSRLGKMRVYAY